MRVLTRPNSITVAALLAAGVACVQSARAQTVTINFEDVDVSTGPVPLIDLGGWFFARNIWLIGYTPGSDVYVVKYSALGGVESIRPSSGVRYLGQIVAEPAPSGNEQLAFGFRAPLVRFGFTRPRLDGTASNPLVFPAWTLEAQDSNLNVIASVSQSAVTATTTVAAQPFTLSANGISRVVFTANGGGTVAAMIIDDIVMELATCGSADFNRDGDFGTDADIEAFFACLGGDCCAACHTADFNGDGDTGTDADIEAFFRVLGGGVC